MVMQTRNTWIAAVVAAMLIIPGGIVGGAIQYIFGQVYKSGISSPWLPPLIDSLFLTGLQG